jgi:hypothetical protein
MRNHLENVTTPGPVLGRRDAGKTSSNSGLLSGALRVHDESLGVSSEHAPNPFDGS